MQLRCYEKTLIFSIFTLKYKNTGSQVQTYKYHLQMTRAHQNQKNRVVREIDGSQKKKFFGCGKAA